MSDKLQVIIGGTDYAEHIQGLKPSINGLNADGSGRDVQTGLMVRTKIADKWKIEVTMLPIYDDVMESLRHTLQEPSYPVSVQRPGTSNISGTFYTDTIPFGSQRWIPDERKCRYDGVAFSMTEM